MTLAQKPGRVFSRLQLLEASQGVAYEGYERTIDVHIRRLRVSLQPFGMDVDFEMLRHFIHCVHLGENLSPAATGEDGLRALEIALAAYESIRAHQPVILDHGRSAI